MYCINNNLWYKVKLCAVLLVGAQLGAESSQLICQVWYHCTKKYTKMYLHAAQMYWGDNVELFVHHDIVHVCFIVPVEVMAAARPP